MLIDGEVCYRGGVLAVEGVPLTQIANTFGTPAYVYSRHAITSRLKQYEEALNEIPHLVCFAVKANSNLAVLRTVAQAGAGFDIVSGGELYRVLAAGGDPAKIVFSGVGKTDEEIRFALGKGIHSFNCESGWELWRISALASEVGETTSVALRVNPDVDASTHPYISTGLREHKFGVSIDAAERMYAEAAALPSIRLEGVSCHIGSQLLETAPLLEAAEKVLALIGRLRERGIAIRTLDLGGGIGVPYRPGEMSVAVPEFLSTLKEGLRGFDLTLMLEPGRSIVAEAGVLLTRVVLTKENGRKTFVIVDAGMNDLIRPSLYQAHHEIVPVVESSAGAVEADIVGPVCESGDFFARNRVIASPAAGDLLAIQTAGAYGFVLASNYNSRPRACELLVDGTSIEVARRRETYQDLIRAELPTEGG